MCVNGDNTYLTFYKISNPTLDISRRNYRYFDSMVSIRGHAAGIARASIYVRKVHIGKCSRTDRVVRISNKMVRVSSAPTT